MRSPVLLVVVLASCNQLYGIESTGLIDAAAREYFDAAIDAPFACSPVGQTPAYSLLLRQVISQNCIDYTISADRQVGSAVCFDDNFALYSAAALGPIDAPLTRLPDLDDPSFALQFLRMSPDGDLLIVTYYGAAGYEVRTFERQSDGAWLRGPNVAAAPSYFDVSAPTRRPRHLVRTATDSMLHELVQDGGGAWNEITTHSPTQLGVAYPGSPKLSADGLRLLLLDGTRVLYTDRASLGAPFRAAEPLPGVPYVRDAFMSEDCSRVYFSGLQQILYVQHL